MNGAQANAVADAVMGLCYLIHEGHVREEHVAHILEGLVGSSPMVRMAIDEAIGRADFSGTVGFLPMLCRLHVVSWGALPTGDAEAR